MRCSPVTIAVDTNVIVRLLRQDHPDQARRAAELFANDEVFIPLTVILETEWVLRSAYKLPRDEIAAALRAIVDLKGVTVDRAEDVHVALNASEQGLDFADVLHLTQSGGRKAFFTFDHGLTAQAKDLGLPTPVQEP